MAWVPTLPQGTPKTDSWDLGESVMGQLVSNKYPANIPNFQCWLWLEAGCLGLGLGCDSVWPPCTFLWFSSLLGSAQHLLSVKKLFAVRVRAALEHMGLSASRFFHFIEISWVEGCFWPFLSFLLLNFGSPVLPTSRKTALISV